ncbi:MAG: vitamin B12-dependent ribonucleotide reductase [Clostridiales bacterium]|nr:vitamin B12-dependent ribonucleotide reductase [Clostridiales bacterium]
MKINENARVVLEKRYLKKDDLGVLTETVEGMFDRVSSAIAEPDRLYNPETDIESVKKEFYDIMTNLEFLPNSPTLMNAGRPLGQLSACFVLPVEDSMEAIFEAIKQAALIHKSGGGTGFSFSRLRAKGSTVNSTGGVASGPISFMKVFNTATEAVKQGGTRRGANMGILQIDHPDILEFIDCKNNGKEITNFNISVAITEKFMQAVEKNEEYELLDPKTGECLKKLSAREVFDKIVMSAWLNGEPGIIFIDRLNRDNIVPSQGRIESTNPCGEQPLLPYESCNLGSINLVEMLKKKSDGTYEIDYKKLGRTIDTAVHFLDNVIDANRYPIEMIDKTTKDTRKIGLGVMGWADMLLYLKIPYSSDQAVALADKVMGFITERGREKSAELAKERGTFPLFSVSVLKNKTKVRNATVTTIAPTGTLSIIAGVSSGIEPIFAYVYIRNVMDGTELIEVNPILKEELTNRGLYNDELMRKISEEGTLAHIKEIPDDIKRIFLSAHDVQPEWHIKTQAAFQNHTDNAVSKTVNFSKDATVNDVREVYMLAYKLGCKGVTIYRDGSRDSQVLNIGKVNNEGSSQETVQEIAEKCAPKGEEAFGKIVPRPRPEITNGMTEKVRIGCGNLYITVNYDQKGICEVFTNTGRHGGCPSQSEATSRLVSLTLRSGIDADTIIEQLKGIRCPSTIRQAGMKVTSCPDAIARTIQKVVHYQNGNGGTGVIPVAVTEEQEAPSVSSEIRYCPECGTKVEHEGGCVVCRQCGYSKCG